MIKKIIPFFLTFLFLFNPPLFALEKIIHVKVLSRYALEEVQVISSLSKMKVPSGNQIQEILISPETPVILKAKGKEVEVIIGRNIRTLQSLQMESPRGSFLKIKSGELERKFVGALTIRSLKGQLSFIEEIPLEDYVQDVLESEMPNGFPPEALKAQAILIRTYAFVNAGRHQQEGFDLCDLTHCQAYAGRQLNHRSHAEAAQATQGLMLAYNLKPAQVFYHSTCGGHTSAASDVFGGAEIPYLKGVSDEDYCKKSPHYKWEDFISLNILKEVLSKDPIKLSGDLKNVSISKKEEAGRVLELALEGNKKTLISATAFLSQIGKYLGWSQLKSNWFEMEPKDNGLIFKGHGLGHGVGLCQWGAKGMAEQGKKFEEILQHYFPGAQLIQRSI
ncbi:MAG: SpoIID/LytB domain-containing protein [Deltaproteobacteria bacterium]|nr:SpoIID/LytB domain-containing protein [Deltaproteobacteria bacterium]